MLCYAMLCYAILCYAILYYTILYYTILYYTILYYTILYYTILYYTILYYTILYYTILFLEHSGQGLLYHGSAGTAAGPGDCIRRENGHDTQVRSASGGGRALKVQALDWLAVKELKLSYHNMDIWQ